MIILGIDPGTVCTGYGIICLENNSLARVSSGVIRLPSSKTLPVKLETIYEMLCNLISTHSPDEFAIETAFFGKNVQSAMKIGYARGVSLLAAVHNKIPSSEYSPREVKRSVTGTGAASKEQVSYMVKTILNIKPVKMLPDETDALAVAICHALRAKTTAKGKKDWKSFIEAFPERVLNI
jgi:crossover junction endodeoxyribonuclease RuvC